MMFWFTVVFINVETSELFNVTADSHCSSLTPLRIDRDGDEYIISMQGLNLLRLDKNYKCLGKL